MTASLFTSEVLLILATSTFLAGVVTCLDAPFEEPQPEAAVPRDKLENSGYIKCDCTKDFEGGDGQLFSANKVTVHCVEKTCTGKWCVKQELEDGSNVEKFCTNNDDHNPVCSIAPVAKLGLQKVRTCYCEDKHYCNGVAGFRVATMMVVASISLFILLNLIL